MSADVDVELPDELFGEILSRFGSLPQLFRAGRVSRKWLSLVKRLAPIVAARFFPDELLFQKLDPWVTTENYRVLLPLLSHTYLNHFTRLLSIWLISDDASAEKDQSFMISEKGSVLWDVRSSTVRFAQSVLIQMLHNNPKLEALVIYGSSPNVPKLVDALIAHSQQLVYFYYESSMDLDLVKKLIKGIPSLEAVSLPNQISTTKQLGWKESSTWITGEEGRPPRLKNLLHSTGWSKGFPGRGGAGAAGDDESKATWVITQPVALRPQ